MTKQIWRVKMTEREQKEDPTHSPKMYLENKMEVHNKHTFL